MIGCLPTQALAFLAVFVYATQAIAFEWKPGFSQSYESADVVDWSSTDAAVAGGGVTTPSRMIESTAGDERPVSAPVEVDMRHYNSLMSAVPLESTSIPLIMHCMLEQVGITLPSCRLLNNILF